MYTQFFGNYLLNHNIISKEQLLKAMKDQTKTHVKLGTLAIYEGYMTAGEVENVHILQTHEDRKFGELAVDEGYLTSEQVDALCEAQKPDYLTFGQCLIDNGFITSEQFEDLIFSYQSEFEIDNLDFDEEQKNKVVELVKDFYAIDDIENADKFINYLILFFNNLVRFIGGDFTPLSAENMGEYATDYCFVQKIEGDFDMFTAIDMDEDTAIEFASRYVGKQMTDYDEYVSASIEDFLNLHNGLFSVNMSNDFAMELSLQPLEEKSDALLSKDGSTIYFIPVIYPFGTLNIVVAV